MKTFSRLLCALLLTEFCLYGQTPIPPAAGDGSESNPYRIASLGNLYWIAASDQEVPEPPRAERWSWDTFYIQTQDINAAATATWDDGDGGAPEGWRPIGNFNSRFYGSYDGNGHVIKNLYINRPFTAENQGLFGVYWGGYIKNLGLINVNITGQEEGMSWYGTGALIGMCDGGEITNCYSTGSVTSHYSLVGGLIGVVMDGSSINRCFSTADVNGPLSGGLIGRISGNVEISSCFSTGDVDASSSEFSVQSGGLIGSLEGEENAQLSNCYSIGSVIAENDPTAGGLAGSISGCQVINCYSAGAVNAMGDHVGGLIGTILDESPVLFSFWDVETSGQSTSAGGTGKTTAQMKTKSTFTSAGWDFVGESENGNDDIWDIDSGKNDGYPFFSWQSFEPPVAVKLSGISAYRVGAHAVIEWHTIEETNLAGFILERLEVDSGIRRQIASFQDDPTLAAKPDIHGEKLYRVKDPFVEPEKDYIYCLSDVSLDGKITRHPAVYLAKTNPSHRLLRPQLHQAYPNPFNPVTTIPFSIPTTAPVTLAVYDLDGRLVKTLINETLNAGEHQISWNAEDQPAGLYFVKMTAPDFSLVRRVVLVK